MEVVKEKYEMNKFEDSFCSISQEFTKHGATKENVQALNNLDKQITEVMRHVEKECSKVPTCKLYAWSTKLKEGM